MDTTPQDVWPRIAEFMDAKTKRIMRLASTAWFNLIKYNDFTLYFTKLEDLPTIVDRLSKYSWPIKLTFAQHKFTVAPELVMPLKNLTNLLALDAISAACCERGPPTQSEWMQLSTLTNMECWRFMPGIAPCDLYKSFKKLKEWEYSGADYDEDESSGQDILALLPDLHSLSYHANSDTWPFALLQNPEQLTELSMSVAATFKETQMWSRLTNLKTLACKEHFGGNQIDTKYLTALENCLFTVGSMPSVETNTNLTQLILNCNKWPQTSVESIANLRNLHHLQLHYVQPHDLLSFSFLAELSKLTELHLQLHNQPSEYNLNEEMYQNLPPNLKILNSTHSLDLAQLTHLVNLEHLCVETPPIHTEYLSYLSNLTKLWTHWDEDDIRSIEHLTKLEDLSVNGSTPPDRQMINIEKLGALKSLRWDLLDCPKETIDGIKKLSNLELLALTRAEEPIESYDFLSHLTKLTSLMIRDGAVKDESLWINLTHLTNLAALTLEEVGITDERLMQLAVLRHITKLEIIKADSTFTGCHLTALSSLKRLEIIGRGLQLKYKKEDLMNSLPYLSYYSEWV